MIVSHSILWIYIVFLLAGGAIGYFKAKSKISLNLSVGFAAALSLCAIGLLPMVIANWLQGALLIVFGVRWLQTRKFIPSGLMAAATVVALALENLFWRGH
jgi:uncharacterized membrane protein (UPF0136 family)